MGVSVSLTNLTSLTNETSAITAINGNSTAIVTGFDSALDLSGDQMSGTLDMNSNQIINLPAPTTAASPVRLQDISSLYSISYTVSTLPASPALGQLATVTDGTSGLAWGATATGGHSTDYLVWYNGAAWTVIGK